MMEDTPFDQNTHTALPKLQKLLATAGFASRRTIEQWIQAGRVTVNDQLAVLGMRASSKDKISLDNQLLCFPHKAKEDSTKVLLYYKTNHEMCTRFDPKGRATVFDHLPPIQPLRWLMIGRLDYNTSGLLLFTTEGLLVHRLLHPSYQIEREYAVRVHGRVTAVVLKTLKTGILLDGKPAAFLRITPKAQGKGSNQWYHVVLREGRQREVRRLWETQGLTVSRLIRVRFGPILLPTFMKTGEFVLLPQNSINQLKQCVGIHST